MVNTVVMAQKIDSLICRYEPWILILILAAVLLVNSQGIAWGLPGRWNPDELVGVVNLALEGLEKFDQTNFDYPSLPKYFMLFLGRMSDALGYPRFDFFLVCRYFSIFLGGMVVWLAYALVRQMGGSYWSALLAALLTATNSELALNSHFAHNDLYVTFFAGMTLLFSLKYVHSKQKGWLYFAFFAAGLTASSKYNGGLIVLVALLAFFLAEGRQVFRSVLNLFETIFVGAGLSVIGYGVGTPTALTSFSFYVKRLIPALMRHANYNMDPSSVRGYLKQWSVMQATFGFPAYTLFILSMIALAAIGIFLLLKRINFDKDLHSRLLLVLTAILLLDLPILLSINVQSRFFLPMLAPLAAAAALAAELLVKWLEQRNNQKMIMLAFISLAVIIVYSGMRVLSTDLLIKNDSRELAKPFLSTLPSGSSVEYTAYAPNFENEKRFSSFFQYPLFILKYEGQELPKGSGFEYNTGEAGIEDRKPDYLIISSFTYSRFKNKYTCQRHQADCDFFNNLLAGKTNYREMAAFKYELPAYLPKVSLSFINPEIRVYERIMKTK